MIRYVYNYVCYHFKNKKNVVHQNFIFQMLNQFFLQFSHREHAEDSLIDIKSLMLIEKRANTLIFFLSKLLACYGLTISHLVTGLASGPPALKQYSTSDSVLHKIFKHLYL
jgi:hypothetical protein